MRKQCEKRGAGGGLNWCFPLFQTETVGFADDGGFLEQLFQDQLRDGTHVSVNGLKANVNFTTVMEHSMI